MRRVYLDHNATTPLRAEARAAMLAAMDAVGNPSSVHAEGRAAKAIVERARGQVAALVRCEAHDIVFTSGATEGAATVLRAAKHAIYPETAHDCVLASVPTGSLTLAMMPDQNGLVETGPGYAVGFDHGGPECVFCWNTANSETGVVDLAGMLPDQIEHSVVLEDAVQAFGKIDHSIRVFDPTFALLSAHKFGGPKGVGALYVRPGAEMAAPTRGGGQEMGRRSGTENVIGIAGFGAAAEAAKRDLEAGAWDRVEKLRNILESALADISGATIFVGQEAPRLPNTSCFITPGWKGETQVMQMDLAGFAISAGSACSSGKVKPSRVLKAMGYSDQEAASAVRVSLGLETTEDEVLRFVEAWGRSRKRQEARASHEG